MVYCGMNDTKYYKSMVETILPLLQNYLDDSYNGTTHVLDQYPASELAAKMKLEKWIREGGVTAQNVFSFLEPYLHFSQHLHHPGYIGHQVSPPHVAAGIADFIQGVVNNPMAIYEMGPSAAVVERTVVNWMLEKCGWFKGQSITDFSDIDGNGGGVLTHGGSAANLTAMLSARASIDPDAWVDGNSRDLVVMGSEVAHYSMARAISIMGLGKKAFVSVKVDRNEVLQADDLYRCYREVKESGRKVMAVVANACATSTGLYDPVEEIGMFCKENNLWFHVDGAHGASALIHDKTKHLMKGLGYADSMIWDTHKMLRTTTLCAAVLFKDHRSLHRTFQQKGSYLFHEKDQPGFDVMPYAIECTKSAIGTKLFWVLAAEGEIGLADYVYGRYQITKEFYNYIEGQDDFECPYVPESNILCFRYTAGDSSNEYQLGIRNTIIKRGKFYITSTEVNSIRYLRLTVINELTDLDQIKSLLKEIRELASES